MVMRLNAELMRKMPKTFMPCPGLVTSLSSAGGFGVRMDSHLYSGYKVPPYYDSLIGKFIVHGKTLEIAMARMRNALEELVVEGIKTNIELHQRLMDDPNFIEGGQNIHYLEKLLGISH